MRTKLNKWGNSWAIRVPSTFLKELDINPHQPLEINSDGQKITISKNTQFTLDELLSGITDENKHDLNDFHSPVGNEIW